jgi:hypothetical protein
MAQNWQKNVTRIFYVHGISHFFHSLRLPQKKKQISKEDLTGDQGHVIPQALSLHSEES